MAGIIKKQILKHLSRFTKNLSPDKINLSTLKGEGQLSNLELDEEVLQNMLDLPTWLAVTRVYCNKAAIRIQWTKLKTSPICLFLDKVEVEMRTCEEPRPPNGPSPIAITAGQSEYGFAEKVVEGMSVVINSITIKVQARAFRASFELWQLQGNSLNPKWQRSDLRYTRITDPKRGEVLTFKEINWQSLRIEADAMESGEQDLGSTPLRLITNQGRIRIALKRRVKDCNVLASKLLFILDDLLWVLTDSQLKAVIHYAKSLSEAMEKSAQQRKNMAAESLQTAPPSPGIHPLWTEPPPPPSGTPSTLSQYFELHNVKESSYHTHISRLDLHICNDSSSLNPDEPQPRNAQGAMQLTFRKLGFDYYPFHRPGDGCRHWERHCGAMDLRAQWASKLLQEFQKRVEASGFPGPHSEDPSAARDSPSKRAQEGESTPKSSPPDRGQTSRRSSNAPPPTSSPQRSPWKRLHSSVVVVRLDDLDIHQVSTGGRHSKKTQSLLSCNRKALADNVPAIHLQFTEYYFPDNPGLPVPCSNLYGQLNGLQLCLDPASLLWMNLFSQGLLRTLEQVKAFYHLQDSGKGEEHVDARVDAAQLKLVIPLESSILDHPDRPQALTVGVPQAVFSNTRHSPHASRADLQGTYRSFSSPFFQAPAPWLFPRDQSTFHPLPPAFLRHALDTDPPPLSEKRLPRSQDVWSISLSRLGLCFEGARRGPKGRALPFIEPFTMSVWMCRPAAFEHGPLPSSLPGPAPNLKSSSSFSNHVDSSPENHEGGVNKSNTAHNLHGVEEEKEAELGREDSAPSASVHILAQAITPVKLWLNHYQYVALLRMKDSLARLGAELARDTQWAGGKQVEPPTVCVALMVDTAEAGLLLPPVAGEPEQEARSPGETDSPSLSDSEGSSTREPAAGDGPLEDGGVANGNTPSAQEQEPDGPVEEACEAMEEALEGEEGQEEDSPLLSPPLSPVTRPLKSRDASSFSLEGELSSALTATKDATKEALTASLDLTKGALSITKDAFSMLSRGSAMSKIFTPQAREQPQDPAPGNLRLQSMKQSPSQHSFDSAIMDGSLPDDGLSMDSDASDNFIILDSESGLESMRPESAPSLPADPSGSASPAPGTEGGSSADLSSSLSQSMEDVAQDTASVLLLQLSVVGCVVDMKGEDLVVALEAQDLMPKQLGNQRVSELLGGGTLVGSSPHRSPTPAPAPWKGPREAPAMSVRMEMGPSAGRHSPLAESAGFLELRVLGCQAQLLASTLSSLGPFLEDELSADVQPMRLRLDRTRITLKDDGPKIYPTAPQPVPVIFALDQVVLERADDGVFWLRANRSVTPKHCDTSGEEDTANQAEACWEQSNCADSAPQLDNKAQSLESQLSDAQADLARALSERERLLLEIRKYDPLFNL
ncbi:UHRF1-binding protein 1 [Anguilla anguilla]|uniref:UHRF1-binding protein 1 n=1 Tax=Anguilla anguilla TaxID=7936 RepID=UPI0015AB9718|nr:UHRF1-binding protein 1 [Anguilla anguilla]